MKARIKFKKYGALRFIGHLDVMRYFQKVMRRAQIPIAFTGGYSPHMIMSFASPLGIGLTSEGEYFDIELTEPIESEKAVRQMNEVGVEGIEVLSFRQIAEEKKATGMAIVAAADYLVGLRKGLFPDNLEELVQNFIAQDQIEVLKQTKRSEKVVDIRPMIYQMKMQNNCSDCFESLTDTRVVALQLAAGSVENLKPDLVMSAFLNFAEIKDSDVTCAYHRMEMYANTAEEGQPRNLVSLENLGKEIVGK
ncbi:MAG: TIGR03936 family radical SAM-associated protein [Ruminococcus sp.]|uniref:TIGR03936 family radical SAM-associated protein n=1 Tax=Ruminococcus sp. TaxID=41978 RepID=UPI003991367E